MTLLDKVLDIIGAVGGLGGITAFIAILVVLRKAKHENLASDGSAANSFASAAETLIQPLEARIKKLEDELAVWKDWAERLVAQVKSLGHEPVPFKAKKEGKG